MSKENKYITVFPLPEGAEEEVTRLFSTIQGKDPTWVWGLERVNGKMKVLIYSAGKNQAKLRGEWLRKNTELFISLPYETTHNLTLKTILKEKPKKVEGLRPMLKRDRGWEKTKQEAENE